MTRPTLMEKLLLAMMALLIVAWWGTGLRPPVFAAPAAPQACSAELR